MQNLTVCRLTIPNFYKAFIKHKSDDFFDQAVTDEPSGPY